MAIRIITDSAADYSAQELTKRKVTCIPMSVTFGEETYQDGVDLTKEEFYEKLEEEYPKTSQPSPSAFLDCFEEAKEAGDTVLAILISGALSGTVQSARLARDMAEYANIYIIDSKTVTLGMRILVDRAVRLRNEGVDVLKIVDELEQLKSRIRIYAGLDTLEYLAKGGRLSRSAANIGSLVNIKPVISIRGNGSVELVGKQIGMLCVYRQLVKIVTEETQDPDYPIYFVYAKDKRNCVDFMRHLEKKGMILDHSKMRNIGPTIGSHIGPGAFGIVFVS